LNGVPAVDEPARPADDDAEATADVTRPGDEPEASGRGPGGAETISQGERRPVLPKQGGAAEEEKTQVIRSRPDDETRP
jgi:hypothetical protein